MSSENPTSADNQQETSSSSLELDPFGSWDSSTVKVASPCRSTEIANARSTGGWQLHPVFHVYQHEVHRDVLRSAGRILRMRPPEAEGWRQPRLDVRRRLDCETSRRAVIPFFERTPVRS